ncbi:MAG: flagellar filament capping protein FliD [Bacillota bacterium]|nr:flagellar filament capping protein FliD [Bacillota bacterium]
MAMRVTGMMSGMDTESIIQQLVAARQTKVDDLKKEQTKLEWKQDAWKEINSKIYKLFNGTLHNLNYQSSYMKKTTTVSNSNLVSVITSDSAMDSVQSLQINKMAKAGYLTGAEIKATDGNNLSSGSKVVDKLGIKAGSKFEVTVGGKKTEITIDESTTMSGLVSKLQSAGVKASFDVENQRLFIGADGTGASKDFTITASNDDGTDALDKLGILVYDEASIAAYKKYADMATDTAARDAAIQSKAAELVKSYTAEKTRLQDEITALEEKQSALVKEYNEVYGSDDFDITDTDQRAARKSDLDAAVERLTTELEDENLSAEDKAAKQHELDKAKAELSYINGYDKNLESIEAKQDRIGVLDSDYLNADGTAGAKTLEEAAADIQAKIDKASAVINNSDSLQGSTGVVKIKGQDAEISLNGVTFTSADNTVKVNGLTITCKGETNGETITLTTQNDTSGIYDMIKGFIKEYSELINEMDKLYNAESSKGYEPLTDEEKEAMSESEVEKWEAKIKDSLLRRDSTLSTVSSAMKEIMASGFEVGGKKMYLYDFGIETLGYFNAADNEKNAYHIDGDEDDENVKNETNKLMEMISTDPDAVVGFFTQLSQSLYSKLNKLMGTSEYSSINKVYDDKRMKEEYDSYTSKIAEAEEKLQDYEDKWYKKFSAMETAMAKMQSNASAVTSLLGGS